MNVHKIKNSFLDIQKCILSNDIYFKVLEVPCNQYYLISVDTTFKILAQLQQCNEAALSKCCFIDKSVIQPEVPWQSFDFDKRELSIQSINQENVLLLSSVNVTPSVEVTLIVNSARTLQKLRKRAIEEPALICDLLKLYKFCKNSIIFLDDIVSNVKLDIYCIVIENVPGKKNAVYTVGDKTAVSIKNILSYPLLQQKQALLKNSKWDKLFIPADNVPTILQAITNSIRRTLALAQSTEPLAAFCVKNLLVTGAQGCGKTSIIEAAARHSGFIILYVNCGEIRSLPLGSAKSILQGIFNDAASHSKNGEPCVILMKDLDLLTVTNEANSRTSHLLINELCDLLNESAAMSNTVVVATSSSPENLGQQLRRFGAFREDVEVPMLNENDRENVLRTIAERYNVPCDKDVAKEVAKWTPGFVLADLTVVIKEAKNFLQKEQDVTRIVEHKCYKKAVSITTATAIKGTRGLITSCKTSFSDIGGLENVKKQLRMSVQWPLTNPGAFARLGIPPPRGILLYGPPGCAKTSLVKALACECNTTFLAVSSADLYSPYVGESEKRLEKLFTQARLGAPAIIFIDEIDALVGNKDGSRERGVQERILATLLIEMDGVGGRVVSNNSSIKIAEGNNSEATNSRSSSSAVENAGIVVVGATNRPELIDEALKRPGRFDKLLYVPPPDASERLAILKTVSKKMRMDESVDLVAIAERTENFSGADLKSLSTESALSALTCRGMGAEYVTANDFDEVLKNFRSSLSLT